MDEGILLDPTATLSDQLLHAVLSLLHHEIADQGRHSPHYFTLFHTYASLGLAAKAQLLKVITTIIHVTTFSRKLRIVSTIFLIS